MEILNFCTKSNDSVSLGVTRTGPRVETTGFKRFIWSYTIKSRSQRGTCEQIVIAHETQEAADKVFLEFLRRTGGLFYDGTRWYCCLEGVDLHELRDQAIVSASIYKD